MTGDFVTNHIEDFDQYCQLLKLLTNEVPTFACFGNHDRVHVGSDFEKYQDNQQVGRLLQKSGVHLLFNEKYTFEKKKFR